MGPTLLTGAAGFLGRHLLEALLAEGVEVTALCRRPAELADLAHPGLALASGDIRDPAVCARLLQGIDTVFHLAAVRNRPGSSPEEMTAVNETATLRLAQQAIVAGVRRFVHVSTAQVFCPESAPADESAPLDLAGTASYYAGTKARAVAGLRAASRAGLPVVVLHPTIVFGPDHPTRPNHITRQVRRLLRRPYDVVLGNGDARRDLVFVADVVRAALAAANLPAVVGEEFLIAGEPVSQRELGAVVARCAGKRPPLVVRAPVRASAQVAALLDRILGYDPLCGVASAVKNLSREWSYRADKARMVLGHRPRPLAEGIAQTVAWIRGGDAGDG